MKKQYAGQSTSQIIASLPDGWVNLGERWVTSLPLQLPGHSSACVFRRKFDAAMSFDDQIFGLIDFKTSKPREQHIPFYSRQLHAYAYALENPAEGKFSLEPISRLGLLCLEPFDIGRQPSGDLALLSTATWLEIQRDFVEFFSFVDSVLTTLEFPSPPKSAPNCSFCQYLEQSTTL